MTKVCDWGENSQTIYAMKCVCIFVKNAFRVEFQVHHNFKNSVKLCAQFVFYYGLWDNILFKLPIWM